MFVKRALLAIGFFSFLVIPWAGVQAQGSVGDAAEGIIGGATERDEFGIEGAAQGTPLKNFSSSKKDLPTLIGDIVGIGLSLLGIVFFLLVLYAGFIWMTAFGSTEKVTKAKEILEAGIIGLLIVLAAYAVTRFVFQNLGAVETDQSASAERCVIEYAAECLSSDTFCPEEVPSTPGSPLCSNPAFKCCRVE